MGLDAHSMMEIEHVYLTRYDLSLLFFNVIGYTSSSRAVRIWFRGTNPLRVSIINPCTIGSAMRRARTVKDVMTDWGAERASIPVEWAAIYTLQRSR